MTKPLVLCILDGVGINKENNHNAFALAKMPFLKSLLEEYPNSRLDASGVAVGLPNGTMGNSEVGHMTIGSGRIINQFLRRFELENWDENKNLNNFIQKMKSSGGVVHIVGMMSDGRVHSNLNDIIFIAKRILNSGLKIVIHFIADGRDVPPKSAKKYIDEIKLELSVWLNSGAAKFATLSGRYFAMDRNQNTDRTDLATKVISNNESEYKFDSIDDALTAAYGRNESDEFIKPTVLNGAEKITDSDGILFCNYRSDRARQILRQLLKTGAQMLCFSQYGEGLDDVCPALLLDTEIKNTLGDVLKKNGKTQLRIAETEKYNHVTYFFDGERNIDFAGEKKILIPSPNVATFDLKPEMSAAQITDALLPELQNFDVVILNYANGDMVGHTGVESAAIIAMECLDAQLARLVLAVLELNGTILITADHGNVEKMWNNELNVPFTSHTTNPVPFIVVSNGLPAEARAKDGGLSDIAPTMLKILNIEKPSEMTGQSLI